jgi:hypothetical protein
MDNFAGSWIRIGLQNKQKLQGIKIKADDNLLTDFFINHIQFAMV